MKFRHEIKHEISLMDYYVLRQRLQAVAKPDIHGENGSYRVRSLYFDDANDTALKEKINGNNLREKFRLRFYDDDVTYIRLEKKSKINGLCKKQAVVLSVKDVKRILDGDIGFMADSEEALVRELYLKMINRGLNPKTIIDYQRDAFTFPAGNVRVTLDSNIRTSIRGIDFFETNCVTVPTYDNPIILEVKWDDFLPGIIRNVVALEGRTDAAFSKYAAGRIYG